MEERINGRKGRGRLNTFREMIEMATGCYGQVLTHEDSGIKERGVEVYFHYDKAQPLVKEED